jgi:hypothetical protein
MVMAKALSAKPAFIKPTYFESLGEEGLTAKDIADSLGVGLRSVHQKIKRQWDEEKDQDFRVITNVIANDSNGLPVESYVFTTMAAKAFVARWRSDVGDSYLKFLLQCEKAVLNEMPRLLNRIKELEESQRLILESESMKRERSERRKGFITAYLTAPLFSAFDEALGLMPKTISMPRSLLTTAEIATNERIHCSNRLRGVNEELAKRERYERAVIAWEKLTPEQRASIPCPNRANFGL